MVFEYMDHDLTGILSQPQYIFDASHLKSFSHQILSGLAYLHDRAVLHRDMKGSNILVNAQGELKLADFGLARFYNKRRVADYTNRVITLWYRPPELLLGATEYGPEVDTWSAGYVAALLERAFRPSKTDTLPPCPYSKVHHPRAVLQKDPLPWHGRDHPARAHLRRLRHAARA
jgi:serine/threonine protein kinase